jgi:DNA-binding transcriptional ArsR family regulator
MRIAAPVGCIAIRVIFNHMVERRTPLLDDTYGALSHTVRRDLLDSLRSGPSTVTDLAEPFDVSLAAVSKHIGVLEDAGLVSRTQVGRTRIVTLEPRPLVDARAWIDTYRTFWEERLDALEAHLRRGGARDGRR